MKLNFLLKSSLSLLSIITSSVYGLKLDECERLKNYLSSKKSIISCRNNDEGKIDYLSIDNHDLTEDDINEIFSYDSITSLTYEVRMMYEPPYRNIPTSINNLKNLEILQIYYDDYINECSRYCPEFYLNIIEKNTLKDLKNLKDLIISGIMITQDNIDEISTLTNLESLDFYHSSLGSSLDYKPLSNLDKVTSLYIIHGWNYYNYNIPEVSKYFSTNKNQKELISTFKSLKSLVVEIFDTDPDTSYLKQLNNLTFLRIKSYFSDFSFLNNMKDLEYLELYPTKLIYNAGPNYSPSNISNINWSNLKHLKTLDIFGYKINDDFVDGITNLANINEIGFYEFNDFNDLSDESYKKLKSLENRCSLTISYSVKFRDLKSFNNNNKPCIGENLDLSECEKLQDNLKDRKTQIVSCINNDEGKISKLEIKNYDLKEEEINKILSYDTITDLYYEVEGNLKEGPSYRDIPSSIKNLKNLTSLSINYMEEYNMCTTWCPEYHLNTLEKDLLKDLKNLKSLQLFGILISQDNIDEISTLKNLETLYFSETATNDVLDYSSLSNLDKVKNLSIIGYNPRIYDNKNYNMMNIDELIKNFKSVEMLNADLYKYLDISYLGKLNSLTKLRLGSISEDFTFLEELNDLVDLSIISLSMTYVRSHGIFEDIKKFKLPESNNLKKLDLVGFYITDPIVDAIETSTGLNKIDFSYDSFKNLSDEGFKKLKSLEDHCSLEIDYSQMNEDFKDLKSFINEPCLDESIDLSDCEKLKEYLKDKRSEIHSCENNNEGKISSLNIFNYDLNEDEVNKILSYNTITELKYLIYGNRYFSNDIYKDIPSSINNLKNLTSLTIDYAEIYNSCSRWCPEYYLNVIDKNTLKDLINLKDLEIHGILISQDNIDEISTLNNLESLTFSEFGTDGTLDYKSLNNLDKLTKLKIQDKSPCYYNDLMTKIENSDELITSFKSLEILDADIYDESTLNKITKLNNLTKLILHTNTVDYTFLEKLTNLTDLTLYSYSVFEIKTNEVYDTIEKFKLPDNLKTLYMEGFYIIDDVADAIEASTNLNQIEFHRITSFKKLSDEGYKKLKSLETRCSLEVIYSENSEAVNDLHSFKNESCIDKELDLSDCGKLQDYLKDRKSKITSCSNDGEGKISKLTIENYDLLEDEIKKMLSYDSITELHYEVIVNAYNPEEIQFYKNIPSFINNLKNLTSL
ncbi:hypothetical protein BCR32DRAFT_162166 [Anaeromyces robustus]|uniref:RNI-like protein n=1 Tax=Anaeromyces robustus TaxID=1754192 RepID=A0A1Y1XA92_9FUNG|nr:hypothetical protein BCR32DRAFT_162166 [Anaeromyces robustus]|eukprot:ORX82658.1 hypothetical protein BCR32DRAFT_162166 [Anaeromyces robustus]